MSLLGFEGFARGLKAYIGHAARCDSERIAYIAGQVLSDALNIATDGLPYLGNLSRAGVDGRFARMIPLRTAIDWRPICLTVPCHQNQASSGDRLLQPTESSGEGKCVL
ncbi:hypothetical protein N7519_005270 [Penicillium mononematosum]|uniref:uncharacterized protein n=1 Tax=Penicillium mononematosum TaxID=268346 RepID=UPI002547729E|nr:uncharacterized protein N7519_005270 [Penicillium mononematosum]KAJ6183969.1 hypothetical protein N7519_005270 [Penicillium mononematosum]